MSDDLYGINPKKLGFGLMRLPCDGDAVDLDQAAQMVDLFLQRGYTYFDTAYPYHAGQSEQAVQTLLAQKYPRESYTLATKFPVWACNTPEDMQKILDTQLARTGADYFDLYLLHALSKDRIEKAEQLGLWPFMQSLKEKGLARHIGCSFHDSAAVLDALLDAHPEIEFVQLQINYLDWESDSVQSRLCYETARKHGKPVIIMEPIKGGSLTELAPETRAMLAEADPDATPAAWALRFAASLDGVMTILSGMSTPGQMAENLDLFDDIRPLDDEEQAVLRRVVDELNKVETVPCTACEYCIEGCPVGIRIPDMIKLLNNYLRLNYIAPLKGSYNALLRDYPARARDCIACGACEGVCPQGIPIIDTLAQFAALFDNE